MTTYREEIIKRTDGDVIWHNTFSEDADPQDRLIALAYWMGYRTCMREAYTNHKHIKAAQKERANNCRYHKLANWIIGDSQFQIAHPDLDIADAINDIIPDNKQPLI